MELKGELFGGKGEVIALKGELFEGKGELIALKRELFEGKGELKIILICGRALGAIRVWSKTTKFSAEGSHAQPI